MAFASVPCGARLATAGISTCSRGCNVLMPISAMSHTLFDASPEGQPCFVCDAPSISHGALRLPSGSMVFFDRPDLWAAVRRESGDAWPALENQALRAISRRILCFLLIPGVALPDDSDFPDIPLRQSGGWITFLPTPLGGRPRARTDVIPCLAVPSMFAARAYLDWSQVESSEVFSDLTSDDSFSLPGTPPGWGHLHLAGPPAERPPISEAERLLAVPPTFLDTPSVELASDSSLTVD